MTRSPIASIASLPLAIKVLLLFLVLLPLPWLFGTRYVLQLAELIMVYIVIALGQNIVLGYSGQISIAQSAFAAIAAYGSALLMMQADLPFPLAALAGILLAGVAGTALGLVTFRVRTHYVLLVTIGFHIIVLLFIVNLSDLTGGPMGLYPIPNISIGSWTLKSPSGYYWAYMAVTALFLYVAERIKLSRFGLAMLAIKNNERGARALGINPIFYRTAAMTLAALYAGVGGVMFAFLIQFLGPESFSLHSALLYILIIVLGGMGNNWGLVLTTIGLTVLEENLKVIAEAWVLIYGLLIMLVIAVAPGGLPEMFQQLGGRKSRNAKSAGERRPAGIGSSSPLIDQGKSR
jgi:branched-chain amino acid transport system permease protein